MLLHLGEHGLVLHRSGRGHHDVGSAVISAEIVAQFAVIEGANRLRRTKDRAAERLVGKGHDLQMLENQIVGRIGDGADFLHDDVLLAQKFLAVEGRLGKNVGEYVECERHVGLEHARVIGGVLGSGRGIEIAADRLDLLGDLACAAPPRALERHMFEEMRNAVLVAAFVAAAGSDPDAERSGLEMRHRVGHHRDAGFQGRQLNAHAAAPSCAARLVASTNRSTAD